jgi:hypothetical protein
LYGFDNVGSAGPVTHLTCVNASTGERAWRELRFGKGNLIAADGKLFISTMKGELVIVQASPKEYEELGSRERDRTHPPGAIAIRRHAVSSRRQRDRLLGRGKIGERLPMRWTSRVDSRRLTLMRPGFTTPTGQQRCETAASLGIVNGRVCGRALC